MSIENHFPSKKENQFISNIVEGILTAQNINQFDNNIVAFVGKGDESNNKKALTYWVTQTKLNYPISDERAFRDYLSLYREQLEELADFFN